VCNYQYTHFQNNCKEKAQYLSKILSKHQSLARGVVPCSGSTVINIFLFKVFCFFIVIFDFNQSYTCVFIDFYFIRSGFEGGVKMNGPDNGSAVLIHCELIIIRM